jgi:hypothetical protein
MYRKPPFALLLALCILTPTSRALSDSAAPLRITIQIPQRCSMVDAQLWPYALSDYPKDAITETESCSVEKLGRA